MNGLKRYMKLGWAFFKQNIQEFMADKGNFWIYFVSTLLHQLLFITFISVVFSKIPDIRGWTFHEMLFIYGFYTVVSGLFYSVFAWTLWFPEKYILNNGLDRILTFPAQPYFLVLFEEFGKSVMEIFSVIMGVVVMIYAGFHLNMDFSLWILFKLATSAVAGLLILAGIFTILSAISFWVKGHAPFVSPMMYFMDFAQYPITIYGNWLRVILTFVIPLGFIGFYPAASVLRFQEYRLLYPCTLAWGIVMFLAGYLLWNHGLKRYESTGS